MQKVERERERERGRERERESKLLIYANFVSPKAF